MNIGEFVSICKKSQNDLKNYVFSRLRDTHNDITYKDGFVYAKGKFPVLLVAHLDTVHGKLPDKIYYNQDKTQLFSLNGIGGDDRCGVYIILEILKKFNCSVVFCEDEEIGGKGASKFVEWFLDTRSSELNDFCYIVELDRKGSTDAVFYDCANDDFESFVCKEYFKTAFGTFSDISFIAPMFGVAAVNLSSGYYNAHTKNEYVVIDEVDTIVQEVCKLLNRTDGTRFEYVEYIYNKSYKYNGGYCDYRRYDDYDNYDYYDDCGYIIEYKYGDTTKVEHVTASSIEEAIGTFCMTHDDVRFRDITDIIED